MKLQIIRGLSVRVDRVSEIILKCICKKLDVGYVLD
jgi:hypothetical protein